MVVSLPAETRLLPLSDVVGGTPVSRSLKKTTTHAEAVEELRRAVACAQTRQEFGKALRAFREAITGQGGRPLAARIFISKSTLSAWENGKHAFKEKVLRAHLHNLDVDEETIDFCLKHRQRIEDLTALSNASRSPQLAATKIGDPVPASISPERGQWRILERILRENVAYLVGLVFFLGYVFWSISRMHIDIQEPKPLPPVTKLREWVTGVYSSQEDYSACMRTEKASAQDHAIVSMFFGCFYYDWRLTPVASADGYAVISVDSGKCLDRTDDDQVVQQTCSSNDSAQSWQIVLLGHQVEDHELLVTFINRNRDKEGCLTMVPAMSQNNIRLTLTVAACAGTANQKFWIIPRPPENPNNNR